MTSYQTIHEYCRYILESPTLEDKLRPPRQADGSPLIEGDEESLVIYQPARSERLQMVDGVGRLPPVSDLKHDEKARCSYMARFAHHELQAVELFAWALLVWPDLPGSLRRGFLNVIEDEQRHARLYLDRLRAMGAELGDEPLSDFFWRHLPGVLESEHGPKAFLCAMGLTLEQANLDFALYFRDAFRRAGDEESAAALHTVREEEIGHVALAYKWLEDLKDPALSDVEAYDTYVPYPFAAAQARGKGFDEKGRRLAGLSPELIQHVRQAKHYTLEFNRETTGAVLLPNLAGEEGESWKRMRFHPKVSRVVSLWRCLFSKDALVLAEGKQAASPWPETLGKPPERPVFAQMENSGRLVPWFVDSGIPDFCAKRKLRVDLPDPKRVRRVHDKAFAQVFVQAENLLPAPLKDIIHVFPAPRQKEDVERLYSEVLNVVSAWPEWARANFTLKPRLGSSGRGRLAGKEGALERKAFLSFVQRCQEREGFLLEPWLERKEDLSSQYWIHADGSVEHLGSLRLFNNASGGYLGHGGLLCSQRSVISGSPFDQQLIHTSMPLVREVAAQDYVGPLGVDAFSFQDPESEAVLFRPLLECNARYTMGTIALGLVKRVQESELYPALKSSKDIPFTFWMDGAEQPAQESDASTSTLRIELSGDANGPVLNFALGEVLVKEK